MVSAFVLKQLTSATEGLLAQEKVPESFLLLTWAHTVNAVWKISIFRCLRKVRPLLNAPVESNSHLGEEGIKIS